MFSNKTPQIAVHLDYTKTFVLYENMVETRTIGKQLRLKLCKNLRTTSLGQNLVVLIKKRV